MTGAVAFVAVVTLAGAIGSLVWLAHRLATTTSREADSRVRAAKFEADLATSQANEKTQRDRADNEQRRADAFDDLLDQVALDGDAAGARAWVLAKYAREAGTADGDAAGIVSAVSGPEGEPRLDRDDLIRPGD